MGTVLVATNFERRSPCCGRHTVREKVASVTRKTWKKDLKVMAPVALEGGSVSELNTVLELKEWLYGRVSDDNDVVVDDLQADHNEKLELDDEREGIKGTKDR